MSGSKEKMVSALVWSVILNIINALYGFVAAPLLIRYFGKADYGLIALATSINGYMALMDMGLNSTNVRFFSTWLAKGDNVKVNKLMQTCTAFYSFIGCINIVVLFVIYNFVGSIFNISPEQIVVFKQILLVLMVMAMINWYTSCFNQIISATENVAWVQKRMLLSKILMIGVLILTLTLKLSLIQFFIATQIVTIVIIPLTIRKIMQLTPFISFFARFDWNTFKEIIPYSLNIFSFGVFQFSFYNLRVFFLGMQGSTSDITEFQIMNSLIGLVTSVSSIFIGVLLPTASRVVANGDNVNYYRVAYQGTKYVTVCLCFCSMGMLTVCRDLLMVYVGESFIHLVPWLSLWLIFVLANHNQCISSLILAGSDVRAISRISMVSSIVGLIICWFSIPTMGAGGPVVALSVYLIIQTLFYWLYYWPKKMKIDTKIVLTQSFAPFAILGLSIAFLLRILPHFENLWLNISVYGVAFFLFYALGTWMLFKQEDRDFILSVLIKKHGK